QYRVAREPPRNEPAEQPPRRGFEIPDAARLVLRRIRARPSAAVSLFALRAGTLRPKTNTGKGKYAWERRGGVVALADSALHSSSHTQSSRVAPMQPNRSNGP